jgi:hypothetical protein
LENEVVLHVAGATVEIDFSSPTSSLLFFNSLLPSGSYSGFELLGAGCEFKSFSKFKQLSLIENVVGKTAFLQNLEDV